MSITDLFLTESQMPLYLVPLGEYFTPEIDEYLQYADIMQKNHNCTENELDIYVGHNVNYEFSPKSLVTHVIVRETGMWSIR